MTIDFIVYLLIFILSILIYVLINYSLSILGYRTFGLTNDDLDDSNIEKYTENPSDTLSYEAYILAIFIRNFIISIGVGSFILFIVRLGFLSDLQSYKILIVSLFYFLVLVISL